MRSLTSRARTSRARAGGSRSSSSTGRRRAITIRRGGSDPLLSPIAAANGGLLVLLDVGALPAGVQWLVARAHAEGRAPWEGGTVAFALAVTSRLRLSELVRRGGLDAGLAGRFSEEGSASLPRLRDRPEDLRAIVSDKLAREGLRARGAPVGLDDAAFARLLDHPFEGEDAELTALVQRLVAGCDGPVVRAEHVDSLIAQPSLQNEGGRCRTGDVATKLSVNLN